jgi:hypothetical protein
MDCEKELAELKALLSEYLDTEYTTENDGISCSNCNGGFKPHDEWCVYRRLREAVGLPPK